MPKKSFRPSRWQLLPPVFSGSTLKIIAIVTMLIDHIGAVILEKGYMQAYQMNLPQAGFSTLTNNLGFQESFI